MEPLTVGLIITGGLAVASAIRNKKSPTFDVLDDGQWIHPLPRLSIDGVVYNPTVSDGFKQSKTDDHRRHLGVDLDYQKHGKKGELPQYVKLPSATNSKRYAFFYPPGIPTRAARDGVVWSAGHGEKGWFVRTVHNHGRLLVFYQHLESLAQPFERGQPIAKGTILGPQGYNPSGYKFRHLHFGIGVWSDKLGQFVYVDPESVGGKGLKNFPVLFNVEV